MYAIRSYYDRAYVCKKHGFGVPVITSYSIHYTKLYDGVGYAVVAVKIRAGNQLNGIYRIGCGTVIFEAVRGNSWAGAIGSGAIVEIPDIEGGILGGIVEGGFFGIAKGVIGKIEAGAYLRIHLYGFLYRINAAGCILSD